MPPSPPPPARPARPIASFFAIGDWGYLDEWRKGHVHTAADHGWYTDWRLEYRLANGDCQGKLADRMREVAAERAQTELPFKFVVNVGDNFYPAGVVSVNDPVWDTEWGNVYHTLPKMKWYSTYGNHDYGQLNRPCVCSDGKDNEGTACAQVQKHGGVHNNQQWHMPSMNYYETPLPGVNLEIVSIDTNVVDAHKICPWIVCGCYACPCKLEKEAVEDNSTQLITKALRARRLDQRRLFDDLEEYGDEGNGTQRMLRRAQREQMQKRGRRRLDNFGRCSAEVCKKTLSARAEQGFTLLEARIKAAEGTGRQLIVNTHYPTPWLKHWRSRSGKTITDLLHNPRVKIAFFGGHVHATDNTTNVDHGLRRHGWNDYCVGGGGGWACDYPHTQPVDVSQGFVTGEVRSDGQVANFRFEHVPDSICCELNANYTGAH